MHHDDMLVQQQLARLWLPGRETMWLWHLTIRAGVPLEPFELLLVALTGDICAQNILYLLHDGVGPFIVLHQTQSSDQENTLDIPVRHLWHRI